MKLRVYMAVHSSPYDDDGYYYYYYYDDDDDDDDDDVDDDFSDCNHHTLPQSYLAERSNTNAILRSKTVSKGARGGHPRVHLLSHRVCCFIVCIAYLMSLA